MAVCGVPCVAGVALVFLPPGEEGEVPLCTSVRDARLSKGKGRIDSSLSCSHNSSIKSAIVFLNYFVPDSDRLIIIMPQLT